MVKKINIADDLEQEKEVEIKKSERLDSFEKRQDKIKSEVKEFYQNNNYHLQKPQSSFKGLVFLVVIWSIVFGLFAGAVASIFILSRQSLAIPFINKKIDLTQFFPTKEITLTTEKNITVLSETRVADLIKDLDDKTIRIFKAKSAEEADFLEQIYAPWQTVSLGVFVSSDGWFIAPQILEQGEYVALDKENKILEVRKIIKDNLTGISFGKIDLIAAPEMKLNSKEEISQGQQVMVLDKFKNFHFTEINQTETRNIYKTEDLVRSSDKFSDFMSLDQKTSLGAIPQGLVIGLNGKLSGLIVQQKVIPAWRIQLLLNQVLATQEITRPFLGLDYLLIDEAPGLTSPRFKDLKYGAIVYGQPIEKSPAAEAEIKNADAIVKIDDVLISKDQNLTYLIQQKMPGDQIKLTLWRQGEEKIVEVKLGELK